MDSDVMPLWPQNHRVLRALPRNWHVLYVDNSSRHVSTAALEDAVNAINTNIRYFPKNGTHLIQHCDSVVIQEIKTAWSRR